MLFSTFIKTDSTGKMIINQIKSNQILREQFLRKQINIERNSLEKKISKLLSLLYSTNKNNKVTVSSYYIILSKIIIPAKNIYKKNIHIYLPWTFYLFDHQYIFF